ncbi:carbon-nitrogen hydrolase family protein [Pendulispora albinea]|uniref:Carbon-nitrogen hydrolase family protein n=1 Tax=Pendulispora albinea TaxID=2741071 RepID=A0ABZ2LJJ9_9BACT
MSTSLVAAVVQLSSQADVPSNLERAEKLIEGAVAAGAKLVALPENFAHMGDQEQKRAIAEPVEEGGKPGAGPIVRFVRDTAKRFGIHLVAGGFPEKSPDPKRPYNTSLLAGPDGAIVAAYRKIHLFDVSLPDGTSLYESAATLPGDERVTASIGSTVLGMTICYDVRFPELYRTLVRRGARIITVPAAFTVPTGKDHWHVLLRARAIEDQVFVLAPAQTGKHPQGRQTYGKSLIVDPWGDVLAQAGEGEGFAVARLDLAYQDKVRSALPSLEHVRLL